MDFEQNNEAVIYLYIEYAYKVYFGAAGEVFPANDIIMKFMADTCIVHSQNMIYVKRLNLQLDVASSITNYGKQKRFWIISHQNKQDRRTAHRTYCYNSIVNVCYLFENKIVNDTGNFLDFWWIKFK